METKQNDLMQKSAQQAINRRALAFGAGTAALMGASMSHAALTFTEDPAAKTNIEAGAVWALGVVVLIYGAKKVIGFFGR